MCKNEESISFGENEESGRFGMSNCVRRDGVMLTVGNVYCMYNIMSSIANGEDMEWDSLGSFEGMTLKEFNKDVAAEVMSALSKEIVRLSVEELDEERTEASRAVLDEGVLQRLFSVMNCIVSGENMKWDSLGDFADMNLDKFTKQVANEVMIAVYNELIRLSVEEITNVSSEELEKCMGVYCGLIRDEMDQYKEPKEMIIGWILMDYEFSDGELIRYGYSNGWKGMRERAAVECGDDLDVMVGEALATDMRMSACQHYCKWLMEGGIA